MVALYEGFDKFTINQEWNKRKETYDKTYTDFKSSGDAEKDLIQSNPNIVDNNQEQYLMDHNEQQHINDEIEEGAYDMSHMNEDYDDGDFYGDELEEQGIYD